MHTLIALVRSAAALLLAAFFGFVGWYKAFAPVEELARHAAFTVHLPVLVGKGIGWLEMAGAAALVLGAGCARARRVQAVAALALAAEQVFSSLIHWREGEMGMIGQNTVVIALLVALAWSGGALRKPPA